MEGTQSGIDHMMERRNSSPLSLFRPRGNRGPLSATLQTEIDDRKRVEFGFDSPPPTPHSVSENQLALCFFFFFFFRSSPPPPPLVSSSPPIYFPESHLKKNKQKKNSVQFYMRKRSVAPPWGGCWILKARGGTKVPN